MAEIREATDADAESIRAAAAAALHLDPEAAQLPAHLTSQPPSREWICLVSADGAGVVFASTTEPSESERASSRIGYIDLLAVRPDAQGRGLGRALVGAAEQWHTSRGVAEVRLAGNPPCYCWPGIDVRYTPALCLADRLGYERYETAWNMTVDLSADLSVDTDLERLADVGVEVRSAPAEERPGLADFAQRQWNEHWAWEVAHATGCHYATRDGQILGFAAWGARPGWFGPMGTAPAAQGLGIGRVLLRRCLADQRTAGQRRAEIGWVGPLRFYSRAVGARVERVFAGYRRQPGRLHA